MRVGRCPAGQVLWVNVEWTEGAVLGGLRREEQNENNSILSKGPESWGVGVDVFNCLAREEQACYFSGSSHINLQQEHSLKLGAPSCSGEADTHIGNWEKEYY